MLHDNTPGKSTGFILPTGGMKEMEKSVGFGISFISGFFLSGLTGYFLAKYIL